MPLDEKMSSPEVMAPLSVTMVGTGTGDGTVPKGTVGETGRHLPNIVVNVVSPLTALAVRFISVFLVTLFGLIGGAGAGMEQLAGIDISAVLTMSLLPAGVDFLKNLVTIFGKLESKYPLLTGNV